MEIRWLSKTRSSRAGGASPTANPVRAGASRTVVTADQPAGRVRPLEAGDIARVADLHARAFAKADRAPPAVHLPRILLQHPWRDDSLPSLVYEDSRGELLGHLGVLPRPMSFDGRPLTAAVSHSFVVAPGGRSTLAALALAKQFLAGPQQLSIAEGSNASRKILEAAGGSVSLLYSLCWTRPLRPARYALSFLRKRGLPAAAAAALRPLCRLTDAAAARVAPRLFRLAAPGGARAELDAASLRDAIGAIAGKRALQPVYDERSLDWLLQALAQKCGPGALHKALVRNTRRETIGWYLYHGDSRGIGAVVQLGAKDGCAEEVLDHLFDDAARRGVVALSGQVDPALFHAYARKDCLFHHDGGSWILVHSPHAELLHAIHRGDAFLTRLEGEWWISFLLGY
ncbi:MAG: hypothetical protein ACJ8NR_09695 [Sulfurifustis sp.]